MSDEDTIWLVMLSIPGSDKASIPVAWRSTKVEAVACASKMLDAHPSSDYWVQDLPKDG